MQLFDDALSILLFFVVRPGIAVAHSVTHGVVKQDCHLACSGCDGLCIANPAGEAAVKGTERGVASSDRHRREPERDGKSAARFTRVRRQHLPGADFATGRKCQPRGKVIDGSPTT